MWLQATIDSLKKFFRVYSQLFTDIYSENRTPEEVLFTVIFRGNGTSEDVKTFILLFTDIFRGNRTFEVLVVLRPT